jgi:hypothetical protein
VPAQIKWIATKLKVPRDRTRTLLRLTEADVYFVVRCVVQIKRMTAKTQDAFGFDYGNDQQLDTKVRELRAKERMLKVPRRLGK